MSVHNSRHKIHVLGRLPLTDEHRAVLSNAGEFWVAEENPARTDVAEIRRRVGDASVVLANISTPLTAEIIEDCPNLQFIQTWSTGTDNIDLVAAQQCGVQVANVLDYSTDAVAEQTIGQMILCANQLHIAHTGARAGDWAYQKYQGIELRGKCLCILGYGAIGRRVGELATALGMRVVYTNSQSSREQMNALLTQAQFVSVHCPLSDATYHLIGAEQFSCMQSVIFINNSRGGVVDEAALLSALEAGRVQMAAIDVFEHEPPATDNPLLQHPRVFATPHCAWNTREAMQRLTDTAVDKVRKFCSGEAMDMVV